MKIKVGNTIYDAEEEPIMLILTENDRLNIENMSKDATKYAAFPDIMTEEQIMQFMKT